MSHIQVVSNSVPTVSVTPQPTAPPKEGLSPTTASALQTQDQLQTYTVKKGDNLWNISKAKLGDPTRWKTIYQLNKDQIRNPDLIYPQQVFKLPLSQSQPAPIQESPAPPAPVQETPAQETPDSPVQEPPLQEPPCVPVPQQPSAPLELPKKSLGISKAALVGGVIGAAGTTGTLMAITANLAPPLSHLGGYATAQLVAAKLADWGLKVPTGPALSKFIASVGGPKVAAAGVAVGVGLAAAGLAAGGYYLYQKVRD